MRQKYLILCCLWITSFSLYGTETSLKEEMMESKELPKHLYKILSMEHWDATQNGKVVALSSDDDAFIHFSQEDQLERILTKYWSNKPQFVVLKIDTAKLQGELVYEANPGGSAKYTRYS